MENNKTEKGNIRQLIPDDKNFNKHSEYGMSLLEKSVGKFGMGRSILVDKNNRIIAGNGITETAGAAGIEDVRFIDTDGTEIIAVRRNDIDLDTPEGREMALADNATNKANLAFDTDLIESVCSDLDIKPQDWGIELPDLSNTLEEAAEDDFNEEEVPARCKKGDIWKLGNHRLMCGDSTAPDQVDRLTGGEKMDLLLTDPPYGIDIVCHTGKIGGDKPATFGKVLGEDMHKVEFGKVVGEGLGKVKATTYHKIKGDETTETARLAYELIKDRSKNQIIFGGNYFTEFLPPRACWVVWDKMNGDSVFADAELAWTSYNKGAKLFQWMWNGMARAGDRKTEGVKRIHPTQKPVGLYVKILEEFSQPGQKIIDLFAGSGPLVIAAEQFGCQAYMMEYEDFYCDVIIQRWEEFTGQKAEKIDTFSAGEGTE